MRINRIALDTNILVYAEGVNDPHRCEKAREIIAKISEFEVVIPAQVLGELYRVLTQKAGKKPKQVREILLSWADAFTIADSTWDCFSLAFELVETHSFGIWDALILGVASENGCRILLSEDMHSGLTWRGTTILNPFDSKSEAVLQSYIGE